MRGEKIENEKRLGLFIICLSPLSHILSLYVSVSVFSLILSLLYLSLSIFLLFYLVFEGCYQSRLRDISAKMRLT